MPSGLKEALASGTAFSASALALIRMSLTETRTFRLSSALLMRERASSRRSISRSTLSGKCGMSRKLSVSRRAMVRRIPSSGFRS